MNDIVRNAVRSTPTLVAIALTLLLVDFLSGPLIEFPILFVLPVVLITYSRGVRYGIVFATVLIFTRFAFHFVWATPRSTLQALSNVIIEFSTLGLFVYFTSALAEKTKRIELLEGILSICSYCKRIRNADGGWETTEKYFSDRTDAQFSHGLCADCVKEHYGEFLKK